MRRAGSNREIFAAMKSNETFKPYRFTGVGPPAGQAPVATPNPQLTATLPICFSTSTRASISRCTNSGMRTLSRVWFSAPSPATAADGTLSVGARLLLAFPGYLSGVGLESTKNFFAGPNFEPARRGSIGGSSLRRTEGATSGNHSEPNASAGRKPAESAIERDEGRDLRHDRIRSEHC